MGKKIDLTGQKFGRWTVLSYAGNRMWNCKCSCEEGTEKQVDGHTLRSGASISCGCYAKEQRKKAEQEKEKSDLINRTIGNFTALEYIEDNKWKCRCDLCGNIIEMSRRSFMNKSRKSCGCHKRAFQYNLANKKFGLWTALKYVGNSQWLCRCECGTEAKIETAKLLSGESPKCRKHKHKNMIEFPQWFIDDLYDKSLIGKINTHDIVEFVCKEHGIYKQAVSEHIRLRDNKRKSGCPICAKAINVIGSTDENEIITYIKKWFPCLYIEFHNRAILDGKEIDIYLPEYKVGIEYNGSAFHASENAIYKNKDKYYHRDKFLAAKEKGIHLITVFDFDYEKHKWQILERIKHILLGKDKKFFIPDNYIVYTDNDYDTGLWLLSYGYKEAGQIEPDSVEYKGFTIYRCGKTKWLLN